MLKVRILNFVFIFKVGNSAGEPVQSGYNTSQGFYILDVSSEKGFENLQMPAHHGGPSSSEVLQEIPVIAAFSEVSSAPCNTTKFSSTNTDTLMMLKIEFQELVVNHLDAEVREAYRLQKEIENQKEFRAVKAATEKRVMNILAAHVPGEKIPHLDFFREVVGILGEKYPYVYGSDPMKEVSPGQWVKKFPFRGTGGPSGLKSLPKVLQQSYRRLRDNKDCSNKNSNETSEWAEGATSKNSRKRKAHVYGVDQINFYIDAKLSRAEVTRKLEQWASLGFEEREEMFSAIRESLQSIFASNYLIFDALPGFFDDERHLQYQFQWVAKKSIIENIEVRVGPQFGFLLDVLKRWIPTKDFAQKIEAANLKSEELNGSPIPLRVCLLRELTFFWAKTRSGLLRFENEEVVDGSPRIVYSEDKDTNSSHFSIEAEHKTILVGLTFNDAIASFFHLTFVANMKYPANGEDAAVWLQRKVAGIEETGDDL